MSTRFAASKPIRPVRCPLAKPVGSRLRHVDVLLALLAISGLNAGCHRQAAPESRPITRSEAAFLADNKRAMDRMMSGMAVKPRGDVDRDFALMMIPHHQGGIDMAVAELRYGRNGQLKALARAIVSKQRAEIAQMRRIIDDSTADARNSGTATAMPMPAGSSM